MDDVSTAPRRAGRGPPFRGVGVAVAVTDPSYNCATKTRPSGNWTATPRPVAVRVFVQRPRGLSAEPLRARPISLEALAVATLEIAVA